MITRTALEALFATMPYINRHLQLHYMELWIEAYVSTRFSLVTAIVSLYLLSTLTVLGEHQQSSRV